MSSSVQSMLSIGALTILSFVSLRFDSSVLQNSTVETENKVYLTAFSLADDLLEEIKQKAFDANTVQFPITNPSGLTPSAGLGPANWESYPNFNDIDDFNNFTKGVSAPHAENYSIKCKVWYVNGDNPEQMMTTQTFYKRVRITVSSPYMRSPVNISFIFTLK